MNLDPIMVELLGEDRAYRIALIRAQVATREAAAAMAESFKQVQEATLLAGERMAQVGRRVSFVLTAPIVAATALTARSFTNFEQVMSRIEGLTGASREQVQQWSEELLRLGPSLGKSPQELALALEFISSSGFKGARAMDALTASAKASTAGLGETKVVADAVTSAVTAYWKEGLTAAKATDVLVAAVREGKAEATSIAPVFGRLLPLASSAGVGIEDLAGALAIMTRTGSSAAEAGTSIQAIISTIVGPTPQSIEALDSVGLSYEKLQEMIAKPGGLVESFNLLDRAFKSNTGALKRAFPNIRALRGVLNVLAQEGKSVEDVMNGIRNSTGDMDKAFKITTETMSFAWNQVKASVQSVAIAIGKSLVPVMRFFIAIINEGLRIWDGFSQTTRNVVVGIALVVAAIGPLLVIMGGLVPIMMGGFGNLLGIFAAVKSVLGVIFGPITMIMGVFGQWKAILFGIVALPGMIVRGMMLLMVSIISLLNPLKLAMVLFTGIKMAVMFYYGPVMLVVRALATVLPLLAVWHARSGGLVGIWTQIKAAAMAVWDGIKQIGTAVKNLFFTSLDAVYQLMLKAGEATLKLIESWGFTGDIGITWQGIIDGIVTGIEFAEFTVLNFGAVMEFVWTQTKLAAVSTFNTIGHFFEKTIPEALRWFGRNWVQVFETAASHVNAVFENLFTNIGTFFREALPRLLRGESVDWGSIWTPLLTGAENTIKEMPKFTERIMGDFEKQLMFEVGMQGGALDEGFAEFQKARQDERDMDAFEADWMAHLKKQEEEANKAGKKTGDKLTSPIKKATQEVAKYSAALRDSVEDRAITQAYLAGLPTAMAANQMKGPADGQAELKKSNDLLKQIASNTKATADNQPDFEDVDLEE